MFQSVLGDSLTLSSFIYCSLTSVILGVIVSFAYCFKSNYTKNFMTTLILLPLIVQAVIMMVNGNLGTGIAVVGAFSLVRFRSIAGNSRDICFIFLAMAVGIAAGTGYIWFAVLLTAFAVMIYMLFRFLPMFDREKKYPQKQLKITLSEEMNFETAVEEVLKNYTQSYQLVKTKTVNMGSLFNFEYKICLKKEISPVQLINELRIRNGNLPITLAQYPAEEAL